MGVLFFGVVYTFSVAITQMVADLGEKAGPDIIQWFGCLDRTMLTLFEAITSGVSWDEALQPLMTEISPWMAPFFCFYVALCLFAMMNVVTGVFVEQAAQHAQEDRDTFLVNHTSDLFFQQDDEDQHAQIT